MSNLEEIKEAARLFLSQMEAHRGNEHWRNTDEQAYLKLNRALEALDQ